MPTYLESKSTNKIPCNDTNCFIVGSGAEMVEAAPGCDLERRTLGLQTPDTSPTRQRGFFEPDPRWRVGLVSKLVSKSVQAKGKAGLIGRTARRGPG